MSSLEQNEIDIDPVELFKTRLQLQNKSPFTIRNYATIVKSFIEIVGRKNSYDKQDVLMFLSYLMKKGKQRGDLTTQQPTGTWLRFCYYALKAFFEVLGLPWDLDTSDIPKKNPPKRRYYTWEEVEKILDAADKVANLRDRLILRILVLTFSRRLSISLLRIDDYDPEKGTLKLPSVKGGRSIVIELDKKTNDMMMEYLNKRNDFYPALFLNERPKDETGAIVPETVNLILKNICKAAGVEYKGVHALRRGIVTYLFEKGLREREIFEMGDWKTYTMVHEYVQLSSKLTNEMRKQAHPFFAGHKEEKEIPKEKEVAKKKGKKKAVTLKT